MRPLVVVSDVHLGRGECAGVARDLARLVEASSGHEVVLNGDTFDLSWERPGHDPGESVRGLLAPHATLTAALQRHLQAGAPITVLAGNHDADVSRPGVRDALLGAVSATGTPRLHIEPWFIRRGTVHIEHGHLYDPDNAPAHPLAPPGERSEPVGIAISRRFVARNTHLSLNTRHEATPLQNLVDAFRTLGRHAPSFVGRYVSILIVVNAEAAAPGRLAAELEAGDGCLAAYAARQQVPVDALRAVLARRPLATHRSFWRTFRRLYFDRITAAAVAVGGLAAAPAIGLVGGASVSGLGAIYLGASAARGRNRYANRMQDGLTAGARIVRALTGASLVSFGHTHTPDEDEGYLNSAAFGDLPEAAGRPYVYVDRSGRAERRWLTTTRSGGSPR